MRHKISLTTEEVEEAVREYLEERGYDCGCRSSNMADVAQVKWIYSTDEPGRAFVECVVDMARPPFHGKRPPIHDCPDCGGKGYIDDGNNELPCQRCYGRPAR